MNDNTRYFITGTIVFLSLTLLVALFSEKTEEVEQSTAAPIVDEAKKLSQQDCGEVVETCKARIIEQSPVCDKESFVSNIQPKMRAPLKVAGCTKLEDRLKAQCPSGCSLDSSSMILIPGSLSVFAQENESGCSHMGIKPLTARGNCVYVH